MFLGRIAEKWFQQTALATRYYGPATGVKVLIKEPSFIISFLTGTFPYDEHCPSQAGSCPCPTTRKQHSNITRVPQFKRFPHPRWPPSLPRALCPIWQLLLSRHCMGSPRGKLDPILPLQLWHKATYGHCQHYSWALGLLYSQFSITSFFSCK